MTYGMFESILLLTVLGGISNDLVI